MTSDVVNADVGADTDAPAGMTLGAMIDLRATYFSSKQELEAQLLKIKQDIDEIDEQILVELDKLGMEAGRGKKATMSIKETVVPAVKNWDELYNYLLKTGHFHLLNRAPNAAAFRELFQRGTPVPGVEPFTKRSLTFKSL